MLDREHLLCCGGYSENYADRRIKGWPATSLACTVSTRTGEVRTLPDMLQLRYQGGLIVHAGTDRVASIPLSSCSLTGESCVLETPAWTQ